MLQFFSVGFLCYFVANLTSALTMANAIKNQTEMKLFRGDTKGKKTMPEKYNTMGIISKQLGSNDDPEPHKKYGWLQTISSHIHPTTEQEKFIYDTTQYLSFSSDLTIVMGYLATRRKYPIQSSNRTDANAYLFTFDLNAGTIKQIGKGIFEFKFFCDYDKIRKDDKFSSQAGNFCRCEICLINPGYQHQMLIIDAETFLVDKQSAYPEQYNNAKRDKEWLLMPADPMMSPPYRGYQSRIPIAQCWTVDFYKQLRTS